jgi:hypothetical protein
MLTKLISDRTQAEHVRLQQKLMASPNPPKNFLRWNSNTNDKDASVIGDITNGWGTTWTRGNTLLVPDVPCGCIEVIVPYIPPVPIPTFYGLAQWATDGLSATTVCEIQDVATDASDCIYVIGYTESIEQIPFYNYRGVGLDGTIQESIYGILPEVVTGTSVSPLVKYDSSGTVLWATCITNCGNLFSGYGRKSLAIDPSGNLNIALAVNDTATLYTFTGDPSVPGGEIQLSAYGTVSASNNRYMLAQYTANGTINWVTYANNCIPCGICTDPIGRISVCGSVSSATNPTFYSAPSTLYGTIDCSNSANGFIAHYTNNGQVQWSATQSSPTSMICRGIAADSRGNLYVAGRCTDAVTPNSFFRVQSSVIEQVPFGTLTTSSVPTTVLCEYRSNGACQWTTRIGSATTHGITVNGSSIYVTSNFTNVPFTIYDVSDCVSRVIRDTSFAQVTTGAGILVTQYSTLGKCRWATTLVSADLNVTVASAIATDSSGTLYIGGKYESPLTINAYTGIQNQQLLVQPYGSFDTSNATFIAAYTSSGRVQWATSDGSANCFANGLATDSSQNLYFVGGRSHVPFQINSFKQIQTDLPTVIQQTPFGLLANTTDTYGFLAKYRTS